MASQGSKKISSGSQGSKISSGSQGSDQIDRISNLPDPLLLVILSLLPFKSAVRTSALSKRWTPLCMSLPNLCFNDLRGNKSGIPDKFLMRRPLYLNIEKFSLNCRNCRRGGKNHTLVNQLIRKALEHQVQDLTLELRWSYELLPDIYTFGGFEKLRLNSGKLVNIPNDVNFPRLKVLEFTSVTFSEYEVVKKLLLSCPVLEDLVIKSCTALSGSCLTVCGSALKNLTLEYNLLQCNRQYFDTDTKLKIVIDTPGLEVLNIEDSTWAIIYVESTFSSLRTAHIDLGIEKLYLNDSVFELFDNISHVRCLTLNDKAVGALDRPSDYHFPTFHNLIQLELIVDNWSCWNLLVKIIASSPNLQCLHLPMGVDLTHDRPRCCYGLWNHPKSVPQCLSSSFKTLEIGTFHGTEDELSLVEYFLWAGKVLREISIYDAEESQKSWIRKRVLRSHSKITCKIDVS